MRFTPALVAVLSWAFIGCSGSAVDDAAPPPVSPAEIGVACTSPCTITYEVRLSGTVSNATYRPTSEIAPLVLDAIRTRLATRSDIDVDEGRDLTTTLDATSLSASVTSLAYSTSGVTASVRLLVYRYRSGALLGSITKNVTVSGAVPFDTAKENQAISTAATVATQTFIDNLATFY